MKKFFLLLLLTTCLTLASFAKNSGQKIVKAKIQRTENPKIGYNSNHKQVAYFWGFGTGPCLQLYCIDDSGYIDNDGMFHEGYTITAMTVSNYVGTTQICPPAGDYYC
jgi:hypothetical protein